MVFLAFFWSPSLGTNYGNENKNNPCHCRKSQRWFRFDLRKLDEVGCLLGWVFCFIMFYPSMTPPPNYFFGHNWGFFEQNSCPPALDQPALAAG